MVIKPAENRLRDGAALSYLQIPPQKASNPLLPLPTHL